jgi:cephalosporin-C deacetylase-like acetyl esterase
MENLTKKVRSKYILSDSNLYKFEKAVLMQSGVESKNIQALNIKVDEFEGSPVNVRTIVVNQSLFKKAPVIVFVHGYGAAGCLYYTMFKEIS